jgi:hypothetical protein
MRLRGSLGLLALTAALTACASSTTPADGDVDSSSQPDGNVTEDRVVPPADRQVPPTDGSNPLPDAMSMDDVAVMDDVVAPPMDGGMMGDDVVVPPMDSMVADTGVPPTDSGVVTDSGVPPTDTGVEVCHMSGLNDSCPAAGSMGPCAPLTAGTRLFSLQGLMSGIPASCEGMTTSMGRDGVIPLVLTEASDVTIALTPNGGTNGAATVVVFNGAQCGVAAGERACGNTTGGTATAMNPLRLTNLAAGTYWVALSYAQTGGGAPIDPIVQVATTITPARPRVAGDTCPGIMVPTNNTRVSTDTAMFQMGSDIGATCGGGGAARGDIVYSYTLTARSNVTISLSGFNTAIAFDVQTGCGNRATSIPTCASGASAATVTRTLNNQAPGTYYIVADYRTAVGAAPPTINAQVNAVMAPPPPPADSCPGQPLSDGVTSSLAVSGLTQDTAFGCFSGSTADANYSFNAPAGRDIVVEAVAGNSNVAVELQQPCGMNTMACTAPTNGGRTWQRYSGLTAGLSYTLHAGTNATTGNLDVTYRSIPALTTTATMNTNDACASAVTINASGGVFTGNTSMMNADTAAPSFGGNSCNGCNTSAGRDAVYRLDLTARTRVLAKLTGTTPTFDPVIYVRSGATCNPGTNPMNQGILFCADDYYGQDAAFDRTLDPGTYWFFVDDCVPFMGGGGARGGAYTLEVITLAP